MEMPNAATAKSKTMHSSWAMIFSPLSAQAWLFIALLLLVIITPVVAASYGAADLPMSQVLRILLVPIVGQDSAVYLTTYSFMTPFDSTHNSNIAERIVFELRLPRILLAFIAGAGLAISGSVLQTVTRNPLADPFLFGISSGASLGAVIAMSALSVLGLELSGIGGWLSVPIGAFIGASAASLMVLGMAGTNVNSQTERMLLSGVAITFMFGAMTSLILYFSSPQATASVLFWSMGSFAKASWSSLWMPAIVVVSGIGVIMAMKRQILAMLAGDETAHTLGIPVARVRLAMLLLCSLITAIIVAHCGGIGFVGLMIPHIVRLLFPGRYPIMITAIAGGLFMIWVDVFARSLMDNQELPVGIITSVIGSLFFLIVLRRRRR
ncbi:FecCD family ABC transporter permease [Shewanella gelidii]|uniref:ABC transporter permease n=1 Tax=Shewanella gelidii TaxID=1642821 RepID=A0A917N910_9GAMM|nr:iron ABC transporter permease [Shewanella gelidii]MCL1097906.1 iron ABC transporter permease [Shewanella gelidii]GGI77816.1 ABC transporter permease [Shewanella gelidii]